MIKADNSNLLWKGRFTPSSPVERISRTSRVGIILPALPKKKTDHAKPEKSFQELLNQALEKEFGIKT